MTLKSQNATNCWDLRAILLYCGPGGSVPGGEFWVPIFHLRRLRLLIRPTVLASQ